VKRLLLAVALGLALPAAAQSPVIQSKESPRWGSFQVTISPLSPDIDSEFAGKGLTPYATIFGTSRPLLVAAQFNGSAWVTEFGTLDIGVGVGYWQAWGEGIYKDPTTGATLRGASTNLLIIPVQVQVTYRWEWFYERFHVPIEPYVRAAIVDDIWSTSGQNGVSSWTAPDGTAYRGSGATFGWSATLGVALVLDFFDTALSRQMDFDVGINRTLLVFDFTKSSVNNFGSSKSWQLAPSYWAWSIGLQFVF
jgi:hypothetical protein